MNAEPLDIAAAQAALDEHRDAFAVFADLLTDHNRTTNLTRIHTPKDIYSRHFLDSLASLTVLGGIAAKNEEGFSMIDVGSGAGFPCLPIAIVRPQWHIVSLEATEKKVHFQRHVCRTLGLTNIDIRYGRAESMAHAPDLRERFDAAAARAVAGLNVLAELTMAFVRPGGMGLFWKGPQVQDEIAAALPAFEQMGAAMFRQYSYRLPDAASMQYLAVAEKNRMTPTDRPRRNFAAIKKRPLR